eukprot:c7329_g1_i2.p1 GENE.c7329_g1_i2~~c7329_g1_i2.p1  ORF type:complete len:131 (-),score=14.02 c7329_g1_i2:498-851(-)
MSTASAPVNSDLDLFQKEILGFGSLRGFVHFSTYLRGREELLLTVFNYTDGYKRPEDCTDFLVGCYARYQKPFVWVGVCVRMCSFAAKRWVAISCTDPLHSDPHKRRKQETCVWTSR